MCQRKYNLWSRVLAVVLACAVLLPFACSTPALAAQTSGTCGDDLSWLLDNGRLTISGSGSMTDFDQLNMAPWYELRDQIYELSLPDGLTNIGNFAFYDCYRLSAVRLPASVTQVGMLAFCQCAGIVILELNSGLQSIGRSAFEQCDGLHTLRLPDTLTTLGYHAFYDCAGLQYLTIPASVTEMDAGVFAYCAGLIRAEIAAPLKVVPAWTFYGCSDLSSVVLHEQISGTESNAFYGCERLNIIYYGGSKENADKIRDQVAEDEKLFGIFGVVTDEEPEDVISDVQVSSGENGEIISTTTTINRTDDASISTVNKTTSTEEKKTASTELSATIYTDDGWQMLIDAIIAAIRKSEEQKNAGLEGGTVDVDVFVTDKTALPNDVINSVAKNDVSLTVQTEGGSRYSLSGTTLEVTDSTEAFQISYQVAKLDGTNYAQLANNDAFSVKFDHSTDRHVQVMLRLGTQYGRNIATLYRVEDGELVALQNVIVDTSGYAHFYLASIDAEETYCVGLSVGEVDLADVIVPEEFYDEYGITMSYPDFSQYVITGRVSSWGVGIDSVTWILFGVMLACVVCVGVVMYMLNKRKLKHGYVPEITDEDREVM